MSIISIEDCRIAFGCPDSRTLFDHDKIQKDFLAFFSDVFTKTIHVCLKIVFQMLHCLSLSVIDCRQPNGTPHSLCVHCLVCS